MSKSVSIQDFKIGIVNLCQILIIINDNVHRIKILQYFVVSKSDYTSGENDRILLKLITEVCKSVEQIKP